MVTSVHLADVGARAALRNLVRPPRPADVPGLRYAESVAPAPLGAGLLPTPTPGRAGLIAAWDDDAALDAFLTSGHATARTLAGGYRIRLRATRIVGAWPPLGDVAETLEAGTDEGPAAVLTLGRLRLRRALPFLRASAGAERDALASPDLLLSTGLARPPRLVATFSVWRDVPTMRAYVDREGGGHRTATGAHGAEPFHHASAFIRFRAYDQVGAWGQAG